MRRGRCQQPRDGTLAEIPEHSGTTRLTASLARAGGREVSIDSDHVPLDGGRKVEHQEKTQKLSKNQGKPRNRENPAKSMQQNFQVPQLRVDDTLVSGLVPVFANPVLRDPPRQDTSLTPPCLGLGNAALTDIPISPSSTCPWINTEEACNSLL